MTLKPGSYVAFGTFALCTFFAVLLPMFAVGAQASVFDRFISSNNGPLPVDEAFQFVGVEASPGVYELSWKIASDYYLYRNKIRVIAPESIEVVELVTPVGVDKDDPIFGQVQVYYDEVEAVLRLRSATGDVVDAGLQVEYQGCWDGGVCYPPTRAAMLVNQVGELPASAALTTAAPPADTSRLSLTDQYQVTSVLEKASWWAIVGLFFVAGLALSLTPCIYPMVPILSSIIVGQRTAAGRTSEGSEGGKGGATQSAFWLSLVYVLSMSFTYTLAGVFAGLFGQNLQILFQTPWIIILFSLLFVVLAGGMFGLYNLQIPHKWQDKLNLMCRSQRGGNALGVAIMGCLSALIVGPCVAAPLAGVLIYIGQTGDPYLGGLSLFMLSMGMGLPLLLVGTSLGRWLPQAGGWMNVVRAAFGVVLLLMAVWMLDRIVPTAVTMVLVAVILIVAAVFLKATDTLPEEASAWHRLGKGVGILMLIYGAVLLLGAVSGNRSLVYPLEGFAAGTVASKVESNLPFTTITTRAELNSLLANARLRNKPVMLDFYADWCVSCIELEHTTFADSAVKEQLERFMLIKVDVTDNTPEATALYREYEIVGPPALVFYNDEGQRMKRMLVVGVPEPKDFVGHLNQI